VAKKRPAKTPAEGPSFEQALERLEGIVHQLEEGDLGLDEALKQYEEGVGLLRGAYELLKQAERRIEVLAGMGAEGNPIARPFDDKATFAAEGPTRGQGAGKSNPAGGKQTGQSSGESSPPATDVDSSGGLF
jgi:exodeoxyribonuclease VII small subunit